MTCPLPIFCSYSLPDFFTYSSVPDSPTTKFGEAMKQQVEDRLRFYEEGIAPEKNIDVMKRTLTEIGGSDLAEAAPKTVPRLR